MTTNGDNISRLAHPSKTDSSSYRDGNKEEVEAEDERTEECNDGDQEESETVTSEVMGNYILNGGESEEFEEVVRRSNRSRVQMVTSGVVTVTNVISPQVNAQEWLEQDNVQSLEFEADEEEDEEEETDKHSISSRHNIERSANTIRIQVNYVNNNEDEDNNNANS